MRVGRLATVGCVASLMGACSVPNPAFDPPRKNDTDALPSDDSSDGETTLPPATEDGEDTTPADETGSVGPLCNGAPEQEVGFRIFRDGNPVQRCGMVTERSCILTRNDPRWELFGPECCLEGDSCPTGTRYVLEFGPTPPDVMLGEASVSLRFSFSPADSGCDLDWIEIVQNADVPTNVPPLLYMAAGNLDANDHVSVPAVAGEPLPGEICECAEEDADCCPDGLGRHTLNVGIPSGVVVLDPTMPSEIVPIPESEFAIEAILVRSWQPPICDAPPEYQWIARRYWL